jgi:putative ABC transport system substrate-binding protein
MAWSSYFAHAGALFAVTCDFEDVGRQTGDIAAELLKGKQYEDLSVTSPRRVSLYFNQAVADRLKIKIPREFLEKADFVYGK